MSSPSCPECGSPIEEGDSFCGCCGLSLKEYWEQLGEDTIVKDGSAASLIQESFSALFRNKPMTYQPSSAVYLNRPPSSLLNFAVAAVVFIILGLFLSYGSDWFSMIGFTFAGYAAPILYLIWMFRKRWLSSRTTRASNASYRRCTTSAWTISSWVRVP